MTKENKHYRVSWENSVGFSAENDKSRLTCDIFKQNSRLGRIETIHRWDVCMPGTYSLIEKIRAQFPYEEGDTIGTLEYDESCDTKQGNHFYRKIWGGKEFSLSPEQLDEFAYYLKE